MRSPLSYMDLDIWIARRPHGLGYEAQTDAAPYFLVQAENLRLLARRVSRELALHAMTAGHDASFELQPRMRDRGTGRDPEAPRPSEPGGLGLGRMVVVDVMDGSGRSLLPAASWAA